jgi:hypothetical protein
MFVESPEPFPVLLGSDWRKTMKLGEVFKIAVATTDIKVDANHFENCSLITKVVKRLWSERSNPDIQPWTPKNLDPVVRHYLQRRGFTTTEELEQLQRTNSDGSLTRALVVLLQCYRKQPEHARTRKRHPIDHVKSGGVTPSKYQKIEEHEMEAVSKLYTEAETRRRALQPTEKPLISMKDTEEIVEECVESEFSDQEPIQTDKEEIDVESGILDDTTLDQNVRHADSMDDLTRQLDIRLPPCADAVQILLKYEEDLTTHQSGIHTLRSKSVIDLSDIFDSDAWVAGLLIHGRRYKCAGHRGSKGRFFEMRYLSIRLPGGMNAITIRPELAPQGQAHPNRFIRKWLPELEPASRLAIKGWGEKEDGLDFSDWIYDTVGQEDHLVTAMRIFKANTIVDWLEGLIGSVSLRPRRYVTRSEKTSSVKDFAEEYKSKWL